MTLIQKLKQVLEASDNTQFDLEKLVSEWLNSKDQELVKIVDKHVVEVKFKNTVAGIVDDVTKRFIADSKVSVQDLPVEVRKLIVARIIEVLSNELVKE